MNIIDDWVEFEIERTSRTSYINVRRDAIIGVLSSNNDSITLLLANGKQVNIAKTIDNISKLQY